MRRLPKRNLTQIQRVGQHQANEALAVQPLPTSSGPPQTFEQWSNPFISNALPHQIENEFLVDILEHGSSTFLEHLDMDFGPSSWMSYVPLTDNQMGNQYQLGHSQGLSWNRHQALQSALCIASQLLGNMEKCREMSVETAHSEEHRNIPSLEFLYWIFNGIVDSSLHMVKIMLICAF